jgi:colicin import membrane protein
MPGFWRENTSSILFSVLLHGLLIAALVFSARLSFETASPKFQPLPIDATVVDSQILHAAHAEQEAEAEAVAAAAAQAAAAKAKAAADAAAAEQADAAAKAAAEAKQAAAAQQAAQAKQAADARQAAEQKQAADAARAAQAVKAADLERAAEAKRAADAKAAADAAAAQAKKDAEAKRLADAKRAADDKAKADREAELRRQIADEEHASEVEAGPLADQYKARISDRIIHAWIKPPTAHSGIDCNVEVTQVPGGEVTNARVLQCNGDNAVRLSIENAVYRASPLPTPPDPSLFHRVIVIEFTPND